VACGTGPHGYVAANARSTKRDAGPRREVGEALAEIRDSRLYRIEHGTFEDYCREKWGMSRTMAFDTMRSSKAALNVRNCEHAPETESQARPLTKLATPEQRREAWQAAVDASPTGKPTAREAVALTRDALV
jgi:hypothetical protein